MVAVALLAEGVDRNCTTLAARTAAIIVALLAEGVDRNNDLAEDLCMAKQSPSSRRAWIEMVWL